MIVGYISALELSNLERSGTCQISKEPRDGVVCEALVKAGPSWHEGYASGYDAGATCSSRAASVEVTAEMIASLKRREYVLVEEPSRSEMTAYARNLAVSLWRQHYEQEAPQWKPLDDLMGLLTQIDNMTTGLVRAKPSRARVLSDRLIAELGVAAAGMARRERMLGQPLSIQAFAEKVIRATVHAMNAPEAE